MTCLRQLNVNFFYMQMILAKFSNTVILKKLKSKLNKKFSLICHCFVNNKLSIHFREDKTKSIIFSIKRKIRKSSHLNIHYKDIKIKQYAKLTSLDCIRDETPSGESVVTHVINKVNSRLRFLYWHKQRFRHSSL